MKLNGNYKILTARKITCVLMVAFMALALSMFVAADIEPNDSIYTADSISSGQTVTGTLNEYTDYDDYYEIYLNAGERITATLTGTGSDFDLYLYNSENEIVDSEQSFDSSETLSYRAPSSGYYYVNPYAYSGSGTYTLTVSVAEGSTISWLPIVAVLVIVVVVVIIIVAVMMSKKKAAPPPPYQPAPYDQQQYPPPQPPQYPPPGDQPPPPPPPPGAP